MPPPGREKLLPSVRTWTPPLVEAWKRATAVDEREVQAFIPGTAEIRVAEALLNSVGSIKDIAEHAGITAVSVRRVIADPVAVAWISRQIAAQIQNRLGLIDAALYRAAASGSIPAIRLCYERFDKLSRNVGTLNVTQVNYSSMPDDDLKRIAAARLAEFTRVIDASAAPGLPQPLGRDAEQATGSSAPLLSPAREG